MERNINFIKLAGVFFLLTSIDVASPSCGECSNTVPQCDTKALTNKEVEQLDAVYTLAAGDFGPFQFGKIWQSEEVIRCTKEPQANAYVIILNNGICGRWSVWQEDRYYHWHEGQAVIDMIDPFGDLVSECLGSPTKDPTCRYVVKIPKKWKADIRVIGPLAVLTSVIMNGNNMGGQNIPYDVMLDIYGDRYGNVIRQTEICYQQ